jgi:hypothetical protein
MHPNAHWMLSQAPWSQLWPLAIAGLFLAIAGLLWKGR